MTTGQLVVLVTVMLSGSLIAAPDLHWALASFGWSLLGFMSGVGAGYLLWGRKDTP